MPVPAPAPGQPVYDTRDGRTGHLTAVPSPHSPFVHVRWDDDEGPDMVMSLEHLAYGRPQADVPNVFDGTAVQADFDAANAIIASEPITPATHRFHITAPDGTVIAGANSYEWAIAMAGGFTHDAGAEHTVIDTAAADAAGIALAYVRSHLSQREARVLATDDPARIEFTDTVSAYLGDHHKLEDVAYAELCDVASEAVTSFIAAGYEAREQGPAYTPGEPRLAERQRIYGLLPGESPAAPEAGTARTHDPEPCGCDPLGTHHCLDRELPPLAHAHGIEYRMGVFHQGWRAACACGFTGVWHLEDERGARREMAEHLLATRTPALDVADAMLERIPSRSQVDAIRVRYFDDPFTDDATYGKLIEEALASDDAAEFAAEAANSDQALEAEWQAERLMQDRMMGGHE